MSDNEMKDIWMNAAGWGDRITLDQALLEDDLKGKMKKLDRVLFFRDSREIGAAVLVIIVFGYKAYVENVSVSKIADILIAVWALYVIYRLLAVRKYKKVIDLSNSLKTQLVQQKIYLQQQAHLLDSALVWYILPPAVLAMVSIIGHGYSDVFDWVGIFISLIFISFVSWGIYILNKKAAKIAYLPLIENIDKVLVQLEGE